MQAREPSGFSISFSISPGYSYRSLTAFQYENNANQQYNQIYKDLVDSLNEVESGRLAWTYGISVMYKISQRVSLRSGFYFSDKGIQSQGFVHGNGMYTRYDIFRQEDVVKSTYRFYEIPLTVSCRVLSDSSGRFGCSVSLGPTFCKNSESHDFDSRRWMVDYTHPEDASSYAPLSVTKGGFMHLGFTAGVEFSLKLSGRLSVLLEPVVKYYFTSMYSADLVYWDYDTKRPVTWFRVYDEPYSFDCNIGLRYEL